VRSLLLPRGLGDLQGMTRSTEQLGIPSHAVNTPLARSSHAPGRPRMVCWPQVRADNVRDGALAHATPTGTAGSTWWNRMWVFSTGTSLRMMVACLHILRKARYGHPHRPGFIKRLDVIAGDLLDICNVYKPLVEFLTTGSYGALEKIRDYGQETAPGANTSVPPEAPTAPHPSPAISGAGYIYVIRSAGLYKIGKAVDLTKRLKAYQIHNPAPVTLVFSRRVRNRSLAELYLHHIFAKQRVRGEWFALTAQDLGSPPRLFASSALLRGV
jgi:Meiotically up-regulated gene 113